MRRIKSLFVKGEEEVEIPPGVETSALEEPRVRRLKQAPKLITSYEEVRTMVGMRVPALQLHSADPFATMEAHTADQERLSIPILPGVQYPIIWTPAEKWIYHSISEDEKHLNFSIPLGRTYAVMGRMKRVETEALATVPIVQAPYLWSKINIIGRQQFTLDVISADFDTRTRLVTKELKIERLLRASGEGALMELMETTRHLPEGQRVHAYNEMLRGLRLGGVDELLKSKDPEAAIERKIEELVKLKAEITRSKR